MPRVKTLESTSGSMTLYHYVGSLIPRYQRTEIRSLGIELWFDDGGVEPAASSIEVEFVAKRKRKPEYASAGSEREPSHIVVLHGHGHPDLADNLRRQGHMLMARRSFGDDRLHGDFKKQMRAYLTANPGAQVITWRYGTSTVPTIARAPSA